MVKIEIRKPAVTVYASIHNALRIRSDTVAGLQLSLDSSSPGTFSRTYTDGRKALQHLRQLYAYWTLRFCFIRLSQLDLCAPCLLHIYLSAMIGSLAYKTLICVSGIMLVVHIALLN